MVYRHSTIYGGRQFANAEQGWVGWFCRQALALERDRQREPFTICGDGKQVRDLLHVSDVIRAYLAASERLDSIPGEAFNIGGGMANSTSLLELFSILRERLGVDMNFRRLDWRPNDQRFFVADFRKATRLLMWSPTVTRDAGLDAAILSERGSL